MAYSSQLLFPLEIGLGVNVEDENGQEDFSQQVINNWWPLPNQFVDFCSLSQNCSTKVQELAEEILHACF